MPLLPRTLLLLDEPFSVSNGTYSCPHASTWWRFADKLAAHCEEFTLYVPLQETHAPTGPIAEVKRLRVVGRPFYVHLKDYYARLPHNWWVLRRQARRLVTDHDLILCRLVAPVARFVAREARRQQKPLALVIGGDVTKASAWVANRRGPIAWIGRFLTGVIRREERALARQAIFVGAWGETLAQTFRPYCPRVSLCHSPNIEERHLTWRDDTCRQGTIRLLRICQVLPNKGLEVLLDAVAALRRDRAEVTLDVVGSADQPSYVRSLQNRAAELGLGEHVTFHGALPFGEPLFELYRSADIHVISSLSEGVPRCIAEGWAFCLPTVATAVGGIPSTIQDGEDGLLVPSNDAPALAAGIRQITDDGELRRSIIAQGFERAKRSTAECQAGRLARLIADAMKSQTESTFR